MYFITTKRMLEVCFSAHPNIQYRTSFILNRVYMVKVHENQLRFLCTFLVNKTGGTYDKYYRAEEMECFGNSVQCPTGPVVHWKNKKIRGTGKSRYKTITWR